MELKPCPFCGGKDIKVYASSIGPECHVMCNNCGATIELCVPWDVDMTEEDHDEECFTKLANAWNRRTEIAHGRWIDIPNKQEWDQKMCSVCGEYFCCQDNYCPNCGAKMDDVK